MGASYLQEFDALSLLPCRGVVLLGLCSDLLQLVAQRPLPQPRLVQGITHLLLVRHALTQLDLERVDLVPRRAVRPAIPAIVRWLCRLGLAVVLGGVGRADAAVGAAAGATTAALLPPTTPPDRLREPRHTLPPLLLLLLLVAALFLLLLLLLLLCTAIVLGLGEEGAFGHHELVEAALQPIRRLTPLLRRPSIAPRPRA